jgi:hypothetical protein
MTRVLLILILALPIALTVGAQEAAKSTALKATTKAVPANDIFSGTVTASTENSVTVVRKVPARADEYRKFVVDQDTKIEGKLKISARVSVRFKADGDGAGHALRIVVRADAKANPGRAGTAR